MAYDVNDIYLGRPGALAAATSGRDSGPVIDPEIMLSFGDRALQFGNRAKEAVNPFRMQGGKPSGVKVGKVAGLGGLLALLSAAGELDDPNDSAGRNLTEAAGVLGGGVGGGMLGALGGRMAGGALAGALGGGPIGAVLGATLGGLLGQTAGKSAANALADVVEGSPESRAIRNQQAIARAAAESEADRLRMLMPLQDQAAQAAIRNRGAMAQIENEQFMQQAIAQALLEQQRGGTQQAIAMTNAILGA